MPDGSDIPHAGSEPALAAQALLQIWLSPSFPVGAFAYSHGLEAAVERGWVLDRPTLEAWLADLVAHGSLRNDLILAATAWRAITIGDDALLGDAVALSVAMQPSAERHLEATQQGASFLAQIEASWPCAATAKLEGWPVGYPVALGAAAAGHLVPLADTLRAYAIAFVSNLASAAIRLSVIGQTDGQRVIAALLPALDEAATRCLSATLDDLGAAAFRSDLASLLHETQHTRLFRS